MIELCPFAGSRGRVIPLRSVGGCGGFGVLVRDVDELEDQRSTSDNAAASRQEISTNNVLENGGFASRLGAYNDLYTGKRKRKSLAIESSRREGVEGWDGGIYTIWGRSSESLPMVLKTKSCNLLTVDNKSSPRAAMAPDVALGVSRLESRRSWVKQDQQKRNVPPQEPQDST